MRVQLRDRVLAASGEAGVAYECYGAFSFVTKGDLARHSHGLQGARTLDFVGSLEELFHQDGRDAVPCVISVGEDSVVGGNLLLLLLLSARWIPQMCSWVAARVLCRGS